MSDSRASVFLVDDHDVVRRGTRDWISERFAVAGEADNAGDAIELIRERQPDLVLLDLRMPGGGGLSVLEAVRATHPEVRFLVYTSSTSKADVVRSIKLGVSGYVTKSDHDTQLPDLIGEALEGGRPVSREVAAHLLDIDDAVTEASGIEKLTPREREVTTLIARGYTYRETANRLEMAVKTLESHISNIFRKLEVATRGELTNLFYEAGFFRPEDEQDDL
jgi:DNA-binding NarL/FixJ family response regulator